MKESETAQKARQHGFRLIVNSEFVDPVEEAAKAYCDKLEAEYPRYKASAGDKADILIDLPEDDKVLGRVVSIMNERGWDLGVYEFTGTSGRPGSVSLIPRSN